MSEGKTAGIVGRVETIARTSDEVVNEISSLREELVAIRQLLERGHSIQKALDEYRFLPPDLKNPIRWGVVGVWGKGGANTAHSIYTTTEEQYFSEPNASDENVAALAAAFTNPDTIKVCKYLFRNHENASRDDIKEKCALSDEQFDAAINPLLENHLIQWKEDKLESFSFGVIFAVTLVGLTKTAIEHGDS